MDELTIDHRALVRDLPIAYLAYEATPPYRIIDENEAHERVAMSNRDEIIGKGFLEAFPDTSEEYKKTGKSAPIESIKKIVKTKRPDNLGEFNWDVQTKDGSYVTKYWQSTQYPVIENDKVIAVYQLTEDITERKQAEKQLALTKFQLDQTLVDGMVGTWVWDIKHSKVFAGPNLARMFGVSAEKAARGLELDEFVSGIHSEDRVRVEKEIQHAVKHKSKYESEYRTVDRDGEVRWVIARGRVETDEHGNLDRFPGVVVDISERKLSEEALTKSESRLRFMADSMPQLVWITLPDGYHEYYNQRWYDYTGTKPGTTDGEGWNNLFHPDDQARARKLWQESLKTGEPYEIEYRLYHANSKRHRWVIGRAMPFRDENGDIIKWYGTCTDIDDQRRDSERQSFLADVSKVLVGSLDGEKMLSEITQLTVPAIADWCTVDMYSESAGFSQVGVAHSNPMNVKEVIDYRRNVPISINDDTSVPRVVRSGKPELIPSITDELIDKHITDASTREYLKKLKLCSVMVVPLKDGEHTIGAMSFISAESCRNFDENDFLMANEVATRISLSLTNTKLYSDAQTELKRRKELEQQLMLEQRRLEARVKERTAQLQLTNQGLMDEIGKRQFAEKELNAYSDELSRSNQELEDFAYVASHDLQEPLRKIQAFGNLLLAEHGDSLGLEGADYLKRMHSAANRMSTLIADLLSFSRVTRTQQVLQPVNLANVLHDVVSDLETRINDTHANVHVGDLPIVVADPTHMRQLFQNLVGNAVKFHRVDTAPEVTISSKPKAGGYEIRVSDNGIGFDEKYLDRIFAVFQRLHERSKYEGTGIGLAVCRKIVERYGGTITAESSKDKGSTFIIWLPSKKEKK